MRAPDPSASLRRPRPGSAHRSAILSPAAQPQEDPGRLSSHEGSRSTIPEEQGPVVPWIDSVKTNPGEVHRVNLQMVILAMMLVGEQRSPQCWHVKVTLTDLSRSCGLSLGTLRRALQVLRRNQLLRELPGRPPGQPCLELTVPAER